ncbi:MAG: prenyltransferase/squalene oxidase repeat-containing protein [Acidimicrobiia bacterium]
MRKAVDWLKACQRTDGGWAEDCATYWPDQRHALRGEATPENTDNRVAFEERKIERNLGDGPGCEADDQKSAAPPC